LRRAALAAALTLAAPTASFAVQPGEELSDPALEARARALSAELRCMVCQNQSIDDSDASVAKDLRAVVRERLVAGDSDKDVISFLTARYGEFVLLRPRFRWETAFLWLFAPLVLAVGLIGYLVWLFRFRREEAAGVALTEAERARLEALLARDDEKA
ncbi:cytochrome c-type biogenesis protein CcmH, partial [Methylopila musalis]